MGQDTIEHAKAYFEERGFSVRFELRDLHAELMAEGTPGRASFYEQGSRYACIDLVRGSHVVAEHYADGPTLELALSRAMQRYGSEQT